MAIHHTRLLSLLSAFAILTASSVSKDPDNGSGCDIIDPSRLPESCSCSDSSFSPHSFSITCQQHFNDTWFNDTIGVVATIQPCDTVHGSSITMNVTDVQKHIDFEITEVHAGDHVLLPIPGLAFFIPHLGHAGIDVVVEISGTVDELFLKVGLDACLQIGQKHQICAEQIPYMLDWFPWWILQGNYSFGEYCSDYNADLEGVTRLHPGRNDKLRSDPTNTDEAAIQ